MRTKIALALVLAAVSGAAMAEWVALDGDEKVTRYADPTTIRRSGNMVKMWSMFDHQSPKRSASGASYLSSKDQGEYDCKEERYRLLYISSSSGNMSTGDVVYSSSEPGSWSPVPPGSIAEVLWKFACGKQ